MVWIAPDDQHLGASPDLRIALDAAPSVRSFPSFRHVSPDLAERLFGSRALGVILTGMATTAADGAVALRRSGGRMAAQDEATSVIYGMPRAAFERGGVDDVLPLGDIGAWICEMWDRMLIVVIDDSRTQAHRLRAFLEREGFTVRVAASGEAGLAACLVEPLPDAVVSDIVMPGSMATRSAAVSGAARHAAHPGLLLTSLADPHDVVRALAAGADTFVTKPYRDEASPRASAA